MKRKAVSEGRELLLDGSVVAKLGRGTGHLGDITKGRFPKGKREFRKINDRMSLSTVFQLHLATVYFLHDAISTRCEFTLLKLDISLCEFA